MLDFQTWTTFLSAALALAFAPGPGMFYVLSRTISGGKSAGIASTFGAATGGVIHVFGAAIGVSAILATSAIAFTVVKYLGAIFLIYLGIKMCLSAFKDIELNEALGSPEQKVELKSAYYQGVISEVLNPKTAMFFFAFIPQFVNPASGDIFLQFTLLGIIVVMLNTIPDFIISFLSKPISQLWRTSKSFRKQQQIISGSCLTKHCTGRCECSVSCHYKFRMYVAI